MALLNQKLSEKTETTTATSAGFQYVVNNGNPFKVSKQNYLKEIQSLVTDNTTAIGGLMSGVVGALAIADTPTEDGIYIASETGTYINAGSLVVDLDSNTTYIVVEDTQTTFIKVEIPVQQLGYEVVGGLIKFDALITAGQAGQWLITSDFTLDADKTIPAGVSLIFNGGVLDNGGFTLTGNNTTIVAGQTQIFTLGAVLDGTWNNSESFIEWWGVGSDGTVNASESIEAAAFLGGTLHFPEKIKLNTKVTIADSVILKGRDEKTLIETTLSGVLFETSADSFEIQNFKHESASISSNTLVEPIAATSSYLKISNCVFNPIDDTVSNNLLFIDDIGAAVSAITITNIEVSDNVCSNCTVVYADTLFAEKVVIENNVVTNPTRFVFRLNAKSVDPFNSTIDVLYARRNIVTNINGGMTDKSITARCFQIEALYGELEGNILDGAESVYDVGVFNAAANFAYIKVGKWRIFGNTIKGVKAEFDPAEGQISSIIDDKGQYTDESNYMLIYNNVFDQTGVSHAQTPESCLRINEAKNVSVYDNEYKELKSYAFRVYHSIDTGDYPTNCTFKNNKIYSIDFPVVAQIFNNIEDSEISGNTVYRISNTTSISVNSRTENRIVDVYQIFDNGLDLKNVLITNNSVYYSTGFIFVATLYVNNSTMGTSTITGVKIVGNNVYESSTNTGSLVRFTVGTYNSENVDLVSNIGFAAMSESVGSEPGTIRKQNNLVT